MQSLLIRPKYNFDFVEMDNQTIYPTSLPFKETYKEYRQLFGLILFVTVGYLLLSITFTIYKLNSLIIVLGVSFFLYTLYSDCMFRTQQKYFDKITFFFIYFAEMLLLIPSRYFVYVFAIGSIYHLYVQYKMKKSNFKFDLIMITFIFIVVVVTTFLKKNQKTGIQKGEHVGTQWKFFAYLSIFVLLLILSYIVLLFYILFFQDSFSHLRKRFTLISFTLSLISLMTLFYTFFHYCLISQEIDFVIYLSTAYNTLVFFSFLYFKKELNFSNFDQTRYQRCMMINISDRKFNLKKKLVSDLPRQEKLCVICWDRSAVTILSDCYHLVYCDVCRERMKEKRMIICPICKISTDQRCYFRLFLEQVMENIYFKIRFYGQNIYRYKWKRY